MRKQVVQTDKVPPARVPLSRAIRVGEWLFVSGQLGIDPRTGKLVSGGTGVETRQVCENMKAILVWDVVTNKRFRTSSVPSSTSSSLAASRGGLGGGQ